MPLRTRNTWLVLRAIGELMRHDLVQCLLGFKYACRRVTRQGVAGPAKFAAPVKEVCEAVSLAACFYWKPVYCLQRSVVITRLLRASGINGELVIGYRPSPFASHAWVEVEGRVVNDSPAYKEQMLVLHRL